MKDIQVKNVIVDQKIKVFEAATFVGLEVSIMFDEDSMKHFPDLLFCRELTLYEIEHNLEHCFYVSGARDQRCEEVTFEEFIKEILSFEK